MCRNDPVPVFSSIQFNLVGFFFFLGCYPQSSISSTKGKHKGGEAVIGKPEGSPARRRSRNSCHMSVYIVVCACIDTHWILKHYCLDFSFHERAAA